MNNSIKLRFELQGKTVIITGGGGLLGQMHAEAVAEYGGNPIILDYNEESANATAEFINKKYRVQALAIKCDITQKCELVESKRIILDKYPSIDVLINNAALDPKADKEKSLNTQNRLENFCLDQWNTEIAVGLSGVLLCTQTFGTEMVRQRKGVIINISSDLGIIAPDQRLYEKPDLDFNSQAVKPITYSVIKHGLIGITKYIATYWAKQGIRANTLCPGGVFNNHPDDFVEKISELIPMGRMAKRDEYKAAIIFLASDASSYMTGQTLIIDGGRTII